MKNAIHIIVFALLGLFFTPNSAFAQLYEVPLDDKIEQSTLIVEGKVIESRCYRADNGDLYTANKVALGSILKGDYREKFLTITTWGGEMDEESQTWTHLLTLDRGDYGLFFVEPTRVPAIQAADFPESFDVYAGQQGFLAFGQNEAKAWIAHEPFHTYTDIGTDLYQYISRKTGQAQTIVNVANAAARKSGIRYHFTDIVFDGSAITFKVYVNSLTDDKKLYLSGLQLNYNPDFFGANLATNGNLSLYGAGISASSTYSLTQSNVTSNKVKIELTPVGSLSGLTTIGATEQLLAEGKLIIQNIAADPGIFYNLAEMQSMSKFYQAGLVQVFDTVVVDGDWRLFEGLFAPSISSISPASPEKIRAGTGDVLTITGSGFGNTQGNSYVEFTNSDEGITNGVDWIKPFAEEYVINSWSATEIKVMVPSIGLGSGSGNDNECAGTGKVRVHVGSSNSSPSTQTLLVSLAADNRTISGSGFSERKKVRLVGDFAADFAGYVLYYDENFENLPGAKNAFRRALCTWVSSSNINFRIREYSSITDPLYQALACKISLTTAFPQGTPSSTKAYTKKDFTNCSSATGGTEILLMKKFDIFFREGANWLTNEIPDPTQPPTYWETHFDLEAFALHELGHAQLLKHVNQTADVMYYEILGPKRTLKDGDLEGGNYIKDISTAALPSSCNYTPIGTNSDCSLTPANEVHNDGGNLAISPNPASTTLYLSKPFPEKYYLQIINSLGQVLLTESHLSSDLSIDISTLSGGLYVIRFVSSNRKCESFKFIKK